VDAFNRALAESHNRIKQLEENVKAAQAGAPAAAPAAAPVSEDAISKAFIAAQRSADAMKDEARQETEKMLKEGESKARDIVREALAEKQNIITETERLRESCEKFRTDYLSVINHYASDAKKVMPTLDAVQPPKTEPVDEALLKKEMLTNNDASVPAATPAVATPSITDVTAQAAPAAQQSTLFSTTPASAAPSYTSSLDDDLDIEEID
jgi:cell division initiation protein